MCCGRIMQIAALDPLGIWQQAIHQRSLFGFVLKIAELFQIHISALYFQREGSRRSALANIGSALTCHNSIALRRSGFHRCAIRSQPPFAHAVAKGTVNALRDVCVLSLGATGSGMEVIDAGQHILERINVCQNTVERIAEGQRQIRSAEPSEERKK